MKRFLETSYPRFIGLTGPPDRIEAAEKSFRVFSRKVEAPGDPDDYEMPHSAFTFVMGPNGEYRTHFTEAVDEDELVQRLTTLLD